MLIVVLGTLHANSRGELARRRQPPDLMGSHQCHHQRFRVVIAFPRIQQATGGFPDLVEMIPILASNVIEDTI